MSKYSKLGTRWGGDGKYFYDLIDKYKMIIFKNEKKKMELYCKDRYVAIYIGQEIKAIAKVKGDPNILSEESFPDLYKEAKEKGIIGINDDGNIYIAPIELMEVTENKKQFVHPTQTGNCYIGMPEIVSAITKFISSWEAKMEIEQNKAILKKKKNIILQGAPGTGKTYSTAALALGIIGVTDIDHNNHKEVMKKYEEYRKEGQIGFVTFHQSMDYEDFVEGLKPEVLNGGVNYKVVNGIFKEIANKAKANKAKENYVLIIDEINRGNVSKIFGELITLLEADKRYEAEHPIAVTLPYSKDTFSVPSNLYIIGTMNTTDRSVGSIDYAVRRRFAFITLEANKDAITSYYDSKKIGGDIKDKALNLFRNIQSYIEKSKSEMDIEDLMVGHSYFMAETLDDLELKFEYEIKPLINEYRKDGIINSSEDEWKTFTWKNLLIKKEDNNNG